MSEMQMDLFAELGGDKIGADANKSEIGADSGSGTGGTGTGKKRGRPRKETGTGTDKISSDGKEVRVTVSGAGTEAGTGGISGTDMEIAKEVRKGHGAKWTKELTAEGGGTISKKDNSRFIRNALVSWFMPPIDISDPEQVKQRIGEYFQHCMDNDRKPQIVGMCNWLGITRDTLNDWRNGKYRAETHIDIIKKATSMIEEMWADYMQSGKLNPATGIFLAKNWYGYKDVADVVVTPSNPLQDMAPDDAKKRLIDAIPADSDIE